METRTMTSCRYPLGCPERATIAGYCQEHADTEREEAALAEDSSSFIMLTRPT